MTLLQDLSSAFTVKSRIKTKETGFLFNLGTAAKDVRKNPVSASIDFCFQSEIKSAIANPGSPNSLKVDDIMQKLSPTELERYQRQIMLPGFGEESQLRLKNSTVLVTGVGGLGGTAALYLAVAGVGRLILLRGGELRLDDMNRQILMTHDWVDKPRVFKAKETLEAINPDVQIEAICEYVTAENVDGLVRQSDVILDCAHNFIERDLLNAACVHWGKPMVEAAMNDMEAYLTTIVPGLTPCLSCIFPEKPDWDKRGFGVLGAVSGTLACLTALEAIKLITGLGTPLLSQMLTMDLSRAEFAKRRPYHDPNCPVCGEKSRRLNAVTQQEEPCFSGS